MTAFILKPFHDRVEILSDGATYSPDAVLLSTVYKVASSPWIPLALVGSGNVAIIDALTDAILSTASATCCVDDTLTLLSGSLEEIGKGATFDSPVRIAIGVISETLGPKCFLFSTHPEPESGITPFQLAETRSGFAQGVLPSANELVAMGFRPGDTAQSLETFGPSFFEVMRRTKMINPVRPDQEPQYTVGGHLDLTVVRPEGVTTKRLRTWPDVIGEKIDPFKPIELRDFQALADGSMVGATAEIGHSKSRVAGF